MLLLPYERLEERRAAAAGPLAPLARALTEELGSLANLRPFIPAEKARMTRTGGRCPKDGTPLDFDPWSPDEHECPRCGAVYRAREHYEWWVMSYQLWLAERAVHGALLHLLGGDERLAALSDRILRGYADRYLGWPNVDNVLGPTRPFFSTYLESIWLLQLCVALDLREAAGCDASLGEVVRERLVAPSRALIASYDEGLSNRQTWNDAALLASALVLGDAEGARRAVLGRSGVEAHLRHGLLADGTWYEGENYHLFAHRALWYGVTMAEHAGIEIEPALVARFEEGFATPFASALPDLTFPSRRDSQYAISLRQWRFAELCELGLARRDDARLAGALARLYTGDAATGDTGRSRSTAEAERNGPGTALDRSSLGWKSLLHARAVLPPLQPRAPGSVLLDGQGLSVVRRDAGRVYVALDYGHSGGGHGHPDRLNLLLIDGDTRWLDDYGTGSYVDPSLHWYRSTLAHNAPLVNGRSQERVHGTLLAHEERGGAGWTDAVAEIAPGVLVRRTVVVMPDYLVDHVAWTADDVVTVDLPLHVNGTVADAAAWRAFDPGGSAGVEDGFRFVGDIECTPLDAGVVRLDAASGDSRADAFVCGAPDTTLWRAIAPGPPGSPPRRFHVVRAARHGGSMVTVWSWRRAVEAVERREDRLVVRLRDGTRHEHARVEHGWHVDLHAGSASSSIDLGGLRRSDRRDPEPASPDGDSAHRRALPVREGAALVFELGEESYRRSEQSWEEAGRPSARVALRVQDAFLMIEVDVAKGPLAWPPAGDHNPLDNESVAINGDGLQVHLRPAGAADPLTWLVGPREDGRLRTQGNAATPSGPDFQVAWDSRADGWRALFTLRLATVGEGRFDLDVIVNEKPPGRERRRGQLVLSGARGEFVYLRGDRQPADRLLPFVVANGRVDPL